MAQAGLGKRSPGRTGSMQGHWGRLRHAVRDFDIEVGAWDFSCYRGALACLCLPRRQANLFTVLYRNILQGEGRHGFCAKWAMSGLGMYYYCLPLFGIKPVCQLDSSGLREPPFQSGSLSPGRLMLLSLGFTCPSVSPSFSLCTRFISKHFHCVNLPSIVK